MSAAGTRFTVQGLALAAALALTSAALLALGRHLWETPHA